MIKGRVSRGEKSHKRRCICCAIGRAVAIGMVMGAAQGVKGIPTQWGEGHLMEWKKMLDQLNSLPLLTKIAAKDGKTEL